MVTVKWMIDRLSGLPADALVGVQRVARDGARVAAQEIESVELRSNGPAGMAVVYINATEKD